MYAMYFHHSHHLANAFFFFCANMLAVLVSRRLSAVIPGCRALAYNPQNKGIISKCYLLTPSLQG